MKRAACDCDTDCTVAALSCARGSNTHPLVRFSGRFWYANVAEIIQAFNSIRSELGTDWIAVFGGDSFVEAAPDLGAVMHGL